MSDARKPAREAYDAILELAPAQPGIRPMAHVRVKRTFRIAGSTCESAPPRPLFHDIKDERLSPRLREGSDFWPRKDATDFVVRGSAFASDGKPVETMVVSARIEDVERRIRVFGRRAIGLYSDGTPRVEPPEPFTRIELSYANAYGGVDPRVRPSSEVNIAQFAMAALGVAHPGAYPRNPYGKGYLVHGGTLEGAEMPNLEDPEDLLDEKRLVTGAPARWYMQPRPTCFDWVPLLSFPRLIFFGPGVDPWFPGPEDERMPEVRRGVLRAGYSSERTYGVDPRFFQDALPEFVLQRCEGGERVRIEGMHPTREILEFRLPRPPRVEFVVEGKEERVQVRTHSVVIEPEREELSIVYGASVTLPRAFLPGVHKYIPLAVRVDADQPIEYDAPPTIRDRISPAILAREV